MDRGKWDDLEEGAQVLRVCTSGQLPEWLPAEAGRKHAASVK